MPRLLRTSRAAWSLLATVISLVAACSSGGTDNNHPGTIALSLSAASGTIQVGGNSPVTATLTRGGGFTGAVSLTVSGAPTGVTGVVSNIVTTGTTTTATVTINVDPATVVGTYQLVVHGTGSGVTEATAPFALTVAPPTPAFALIVNNSPTIVQGLSGPANIVIVRTNFTGDVTLSLEGAPTGITATFAPNPANGTSVATVSVTSAVAPNTYNMTVRGTSSLGVDRTATLTVIVTAAAPAGNFTLTTTPASSTNVTQGSNTPVTVNIVRTDGNLSDVALTATGTLPTGLTLAFAPGSTTTNSSVLTITTTNATPVGSYPIVIHGNTAGLGEQLANLTINVVAPGGTTLMYDVSVCATIDRPLFVAVQDGGPSAPWQVITPVGTNYQFTFHQSTLGAAYVTQGSVGTSFQLNVFHFTLAQLVLTGPGFCSPPAGGITVNGTLANLPANFGAQINFGGSEALAFANGTFQILHASAGVNDLVAYMRQAALMGSSDRVFISRGLNPGNGGSVGTVDFTPGPNSFSAAAANGFVIGLVSGESVTHGMAYYTSTSSNACTRATLYNGGSVIAGSFIGYGVPTANQVATDLHSIIITANTGQTLSRSIQEDFRTMRRLDTAFVMPSQLPVPSITTTNTPYKRLDLSFTKPSDLNAGATMLQSDQTVTGKSILVQASGQYIGAGPATLQVPDFSALAGWNNSWVPAAGDVLDWSVNATGEIGTACTAGHQFRSSGRAGTN